MTWQRLKRFLILYIGMGLRFVKRAFRTLVSRCKAIQWRRLTRDIVRYFVTKVAMPLYPIVVFLVLFFCCTSRSWAGAIRKAEATEDRPVVVRVAQGRRTAIHFWIKPEKVIPGSPNKIQIDFLGNDVTVSPIASDPGNLLVYARGTRFVVLFQIAPASNYDDVVELSPGRSRSGRAIRLDRDTYHLVPLQMEVHHFGRTEQNTVSALVMDDNRRVQLEDSSILDGLKKLKCHPCIYVAGESSFICPAPVEKIKCTAIGFTLSLRRESQ